MAERVAGGVAARTSKPVNVQIEPVRKLETPLAVGRGIVPGAPAGPPVRVFGEPANIRTVVVEAAERDRDAAARPWPGPVPTPHR